MDYHRTIRVFDAFPKTEPVNTVRSTKGSYSTILMGFFILFLIWVEIGGYVDGYIDRQFMLDRNIQRVLNINLDMFVATPCNYLHTNVKDITQDRFLAQEQLNFEGVNFFIPDSFRVNGDESQGSTLDLDEVMRESALAEFREKKSFTHGDAPACHIFGSIPVNKVHGFFHITGKGYGYRDRSIVPKEALNFTHVISEFSFGEFYPYMNNPLDFTARTTNDHIHTFNYYLDVVPTEYKKLGIVIDTTQYSMTVTELPGLSRPPGLFFNYQFEPIILSIEEKRISFVRFLVRLVTICGGIMVVAKWIFRTVDKLIRVVFGNQVANRGREKASSLL